MSDSAADYLTKLLANHRAADADEEVHRQSMLEWLRTSPAPMDRNQFDPGHATGSAFIIDSRRGAVLLVFHEKLQRWLQPGGHCEAGETDIHDVARREAAEEVGLVFPASGGPLFDVDVHVIPARKSDPTHKHFDFRFLFDAQTAQLAPPAEACESRWFGYDQTKDLPLDAGLRRMIEKAKSLKSG